ncbi:hypothetical protein [Streptacidiphilus sp. EB103A]|uniref:hypothetical protein n=1 Tax=Streptacidiphilus sp. EB103A TaxID=3156275 RepID=UPI0035150CEC
MDSETRSAAEVLGRLKAERAERERLTNPTRLAIIARLIERHGLTENQATLAVDQVAEGIQGEHTAFVGPAVLSLFAEQWAQLWQAVQPVLQQFVQAFTAAMKQATQYAEIITPPAAADRPAWQSPHGPKQKGNRRG